MNTFERILDNIAGCFQPAYDKISEWDLNPEQKKVLADIWKGLPSFIQKAVWNLLKTVYQKYGEEVAIILLNRLLEIFKTQIYIIER